ncbi:trafficking particle complex subunit 8 [Chlorella sorokiniana]|uniref:Trafficking particle complex subunit 8 n=1 Tax=Chlorella sorokiniana TaxID=3076 RepID=A0A2P6TBR5_CHLSO|nr:trafficking particle complex subunit 8 [Chlorella sorokiniana]|eukprot:PRW18320.1 trafficking particle complex subunit 8 [Chlorella sorokiniana]
MEALQHLKAELAKASSPAVMVLAAPAVDAACAKNGLSLAELLRPFGIIRQLNGTVGVPVRTPAEHPLRLHSWRLRFYAAATMFQPSPEAADAHLRAVLAAAAGEEATADPPDLQELLAAAAAGGGRAGEATPWFRAYRREYLRLMQFGEHEATDHPVACVLALPSDFEGDLAAGFAGLWRMPALPPLMQAGVMEAAAVLRHYVLVHDVSSAQPAVAAAAAERARAAAAVLGAPCHLLTINNGSGSGPPVAPRLWADALHACVAGGGAGEPAERPPAPPSGLGAWLSEGDTSGLAAFVHELAVRGVIPHMEARLRALNAQVTANRKGLKNQLKSLLWRKAGSAAGGSDSPATSAPSTPSAAATAGGSGAAAPASYASGSVEAAMRQLSDLALALGDYDTAASTLRLLASDTRADRAYKAYAGVQEALGAVAVLSGAPPSEAAACYKEALHRYSQLTATNPRNREGVRYATRTVLLLADYLRAVGQHADANWALMKAHFQEDDMRAGLLLEQAAHCLLALRPPHVRKFAFHLVLAGLRYDMCGQRSLAHRVYKLVLGVYRGRQWALIEEHLHDVLGRQAREAGDAAGAAQHFMAMLACPHNSPHCQQLYLAQFTEVLQAAQAQLGFPLVLSLPLPAVNCEHVGVQHDGQAAYSGVEARQLAPEAWQALEAALQPGLDGHPSSTWLDGGSRAARLNEAGEEGAPRSCCAGEAVGLDVELHNPLQLDLAVTHLRLACSWEPAAGAAGGARGAEGSPPGVQGAAGEQGFQLHEESVTLHGGERVVVHLRVVPLRPGTLQVHGLSWLLNGVAHGQAAFCIPQPRPRKPGSSSKVLIDAERPAPGGISFRVLPPMPRLEVSVSGLPPTVLAGEVVRCTMRLRNSGAMSLHRLSMAAAAGAGLFLQPPSRPASGSASSPTAPAHPTAAGSSRSGGGGGPEELVPSFRQGAAVFTLPSARLGVGQELELPVWFRAAHAGPAHFALAWRYEPLVRMEGLACRTVRFARSVEALPSLFLAARLAAGAGSCTPGGCLLQAHLHNLASDTLLVTSLACPSRSWRLCDGGSGSASSSSSDEALQIGSDMSATLHRQLEPAEAAHGPAGLPGSSLTDAEAGLLDASRHAAEAAAPKQLQPPAGQQQQQWEQQQRKRRQQEGGESGVDVVVLWQAGGEQGATLRRGFTSLHNQSPHGMPPIAAQLHGPAHARHDFASAALCVVPLTLQLRNTMAAPAAVAVELGKAEGAAAPLGTPTWAAAADGSHAGAAALARSGSTLSSSSSAPVALVAAGALPPARQYAWCGRTRVVLPAVPPGQLVEVPLSVAVQRPGKLALADCTVSWQFAGPPALSGSCTLPPLHVTVAPAGVHQFSQKQLPPRAPAACCTHALASTRSGHGGLLCPVNTASKRHSLQAPVVAPPPAMAAAEDCGGSDGGVELPCCSPEDELYPPFCEQPSPSQMHKYSSWLQGPDQQGNGNPAAGHGDAQLQAEASQLPAGSTSQEQQGSEEEEEAVEAETEEEAEEEAAAGDAEGEPGVAGVADGEQAAAASQEGGSGPQADALPEHWGIGTEALIEWCDSKGWKLPAWLERQQPCGQAPAGSLLDGYEALASLPGTPQQLVFAVRAMLERRGDPAIKGVTPPNQLAADQLDSQFLGVTQDTYVSPSSRTVEGGVESMGADAGVGYYLFRTDAQARLGKLWALAIKAVIQLEAAKTALEQQLQGGAPLPEAEAVAELRAVLQQRQQELEAVLAAKEELEAVLQDKEAELTRETFRKNNILEMRNRAMGARDSAERKLNEVTENAAQREAEMQQQLQEASEAAAEREIELEQQVREVAAAAAQREGELEQQLEQAAAAAAARETELQAQLERAAAAAAAREAEMQEQLQQVTEAAAAREAELQEQLEQAEEAVAEQEAELQQQVQQAQRQAEEVGEERRQLSQQLAELRQTRQQELAEADKQQEVAAAEQQRLAAEAQRWEARCQAAEQQAAQQAAAAANVEQMAAEREAAVADCHRLQQELAAAQRLAAGLQQHNTALQAASAKVLEQVQQVAAAAEAHAQEAQAAACGRHTLAPAMPAAEPQVACGQLSHEQRRELRRFLTDTNYQHTKLGAAFPLLHALRSPSFWRGVAEGLQAPERLVLVEGVRLVAELALADKGAAEAAAGEAERSKRLALKQVERMKAVVEAQRAAAAQQAAAGQGANGGADGGQQGGYDVWELLMELGKREEEVLEAQNELELEREASSCKAWQLVHEAEAQRDAACQRVRQLEAQLAESRGDAARLRQLVAAQPQQVEEGRAAKRARKAAVEPAGGWAVGETSDAEDWPASSDAEQAAGQGHSADETGGSQATEPAAPMATTQLRQAEQGAAAEESADSQAEAAAPSATAQLPQGEREAVAHQPGLVGAEPAAAAARLQGEEQLDALGLSAAESQDEPGEAASSTHMQSVALCAQLQGLPAGWQRFMTEQLVAQHGAFASLMAQALAMESESGSMCGVQEPSGSKKRRREPAAA